MTHLKPLTDRQLEKLASKRRKRAIRKYFRFHGLEYLPDLDFKKAMSVQGNYYRVHYHLYDTPSRIAALLKYKKHEWIVVAFEKNKIVEMLWLNKGFNRMSVSLSISLDLLSSTALKNKYSSVIIFHNHPNPNPRIYSNIIPSKVDKESARVWANFFNLKRINLIEYICERGKPIGILKAHLRGFYLLKNF